MVDFYRFKKFDEQHQCIHAITTKEVTEPCAFSVALHTGENKENIVANREKIISLLDWNKNLHFVLANQTHSDNIVIIDEQKNKGWYSLDDAIENCDALISNKKGVVLSVLTADCVPILLLDIKKDVVAAIHTGWKGTQSKIVSKTVLKMIETFNSDPEDVIVGIGPSIGRCCYEVDEDVGQYFIDISSVLEKKGDKYMLDLPYINRQQLLNVGVLDSNIEMSGVCTACEVNRFFSYRKEQGCSGRFMSMIGLFSPV